MLLKQLSSSYSINMVVHSAFWAHQSHLILQHLLHVEEGSSNPCLVLSNDTANSKSVMGIKHDDSGVVIGFKVCKSICIWSVEYFVAQSHI